MSELTTINQIVLVGHCGADTYLLKGSLPNIVGDVIVAMADDQESLEAAVSPDALLLVNRVLEPGFETASGIDLIRSLAGQPQPPRMMLVSNFEEAQQQAVEAGALPGFGKAQLGSARTRTRLQEAVGNHR